MMHLNEGHPKDIKTKSLRMWKTIKRTYIQRYLTEARPWIGHYWGNKPGWIAYIHNFFLTSLTTGRCLEEEILAVANNKDYCLMPIRVKESNTKKKLTKLLNRIFPDKETYIK